MVAPSGQIDYVEYIGLYKNRSSQSQVTWVELEECFNRLVTRYTTKWPKLPINVIKYSALYRLIETYWGTDEHLPLEHEFSFQTVAWPSDTDSTSVETDLFNSQDEKATGETPQSPHRSSGDNMEISRTAEELLDAARKLSEVSRELPKAFD